MVDLGRRSDELELMDEGGVPFSEFHDCLGSLETINRLTLAYRPTLAWLEKWLGAGEKLAVLDAGCGGGDMLRRIEELAEKRGKKKPRHLELFGVDLNPWAKKSAQICSPGSAIRFTTADVFRFEPDKPLDLVISSLFTHHLSDEQLVDFLRWMHGRARKGWFINDLHRHPLPYYFIKGATALLSHNRLIRNDAAVSVARSFTAADWRRLLEAAGIGERARIQWFFPFRLCVSCEK